jgi:hypothetical protein
MFAGGARSAACSAWDQLYDAGVVPSSAARVGVYLSGLATARAPGEQHVPSRTAWIASIHLSVFPSIPRLARRPAGGEGAHPEAAHA